MAVVLEPLFAAAIPIEVDRLSVDTLAGLTPDAIARIELPWGNGTVPAGEAFRIRGTAADDRTLVFTGDCRHLKRIGERQATGWVIVEGDCGMHVGTQMRGGAIEVRGNADDWAGAEMRGGRLRIRGNAGSGAGGAYRGSRRGMRGGEILIHGDCGDEAGMTLRRGLIAIAGRCGAAAGFGMLAGTLLVFGAAAGLVGAGMKRGTIGLFGERAEMLPSFRAAGVCDPVYLRVLWRHLREQAFPVPERVQDRPVVRYSGDFVELGKGEILIPE